MVAITKNATGTTLTTPGNWTPAQVPTTADDVTWNLTSVSGTCTGSFGANTITFNGAASGTPVTHTGTLTLINGFTFTSTNNSQWNVGGSAGAIAVGANNQTWILNSSAWSSVAFTGTGTNMSGTATVNVQKLTGGAGSADVYSTRAVVNFTGTFIANSGVSFSSAFATATGAWSGANFQFETGSVCGPALNNAYFGGVGKTLTVNGDMRFGNVAYTGFNVNPNIVLSGATTRTLTIHGITSLGGAISSATAGTGLSVTMPNAGSTRLSVANMYLYVSGSSSGISGPCTVNSGRLIIAPATTAARYTPTALSVASNATFEYFPMSNTDFTFPCAPTGTGFISLVGSHTAGGGVTFSAGQLASFGGIVRCYPAASNTAYLAPRIRLSELPAGLDWFAQADGAVGSMTGEMTYLGTAATYATNLTVDSYVNTNTATLTGGTYSLIVPNTAGAINVTGTVQRLNTAGTASARMSLTLGGTNTGNNTLSGVISEVGTNSAILGITKVDAGRWVLSGNNSHTGIHSISAGTLSAQSNTALGSATSSGGVSITGTGTLELSGGITLNKSNTSFTFRPGAASTAIQDTSVVSIGDNTLRHGGIVLVANTNLHVSTGNRLALTGGVISGAFAVSKWGNGELDLGSDAHTYSGALNIEDGTLAVANLKAAGTACSLGTNAAAVTIWSDAVTPTILKYVGTENTTTNRILYFRSGGANHRAGLDASGSGYVWYSSIQEGVLAGHTFLLQGTSTADNRITANMNNFETIEKNDAGTWSLTGTISVLNAAMVVNLGRLVLSGALSHTAPTTVNGGTLRVATANRNSTSGTVTVAAGGTVELVTDTLASTSSSSGEVLGTSDVSVNGGTIKTRGGSSVQKGQARYGGNLTFGAGSRLEIGTAA